LGGGRSEKKKTPDPPGASQKSRAIITEGSIDSNSKQYLTLKIHGQKCQK